VSEQESAPLASEPSGEALLLAQLEQLVRTHEEEIGIGYGGTLQYRLSRVLAHYQRTAVEALAEAKAFRDDLLVEFRALVLVTEMAGNASTHREKDARLRGLVELLEGATRRLREHEFGLAHGYGYFWDSVFRSDYPTRHYVRRIHELEDEVKRLRGTTDAAQAPDESGVDTRSLDGVPF
jgi:hypothetical protein